LPAVREELQALETPEEAFGVGGHVSIAMGLGIAMER
jgi:hypothetical protein